MPRWLIYSISIIIALLFLWSYARNEADATGGAFKDTKHGGGTVDGLPFSGISRGLNTDDYPAGVYNDIGIIPESGEYLPGECTHCHEPHAMFGGTEALPNDGPSGDSGPDAYLLLRKYGTGTVQGDYAKVCWYCHNYITGGGGPGTGFWNFYQGEINFKESTHYTSSNFFWPGGSGGASGVGSGTDATAIWPRRSRSSLPAGNVGTCLNCHTPHGIMDPTANGGYDYGTPAAANYFVGADPNTLTKELIPRQLIAREEALCLNCHDTDGTGGAGTAPNIKIQIDRRVVDADPVNSIASGHAVRKYFGRHDLAKELNPVPSSNWLGRAGIGWHVECFDCHNPHRVAKGPNDLTKTYVYQQSGQSATINANRNLGGTLDLTLGPVRAGNANRGVWGVSVTGVLSGGDGTRHSTSYAYKPQVEYLYELCLKCHSSFGDSRLNVNANSAPDATNTNVAPSTTRGTTAATNATPVQVTQPPPNTRFTDVGKEFDPDNCDDGVTTGNFAKGAIHPVFAQGCNQPPRYSVNPTKSNARWAVNAIGTIPGVTDDLSQNFVPPWTSKSYVTCVDCHLTSNANPNSEAKGPHGSSNYFILRSLDTTITYQYCAVAGCGSLTTYNYATATAASRPLATTDPKNLCLNCHRADIYGWADLYLKSHRPNGNFARMTHPADDGPQAGESFDIEPSVNGRSVGYAPRGIVCLRCHGGRILGGIHGMNLGSGTNTTYSGPQVVTGQTAGTNAGRALIYGSVWRGYTAGTPAGAACFPDTSNTTWNSCNRHDGTAETGLDNANFTYPF